MFEFILFLIFVCLLIQSDAKLKQELEEYAALYHNCRKDRDQIKKDREELESSLAESIGRQLEYQTELGTKDKEISILNEATKSKQQRINLLEIKCQDDAEKIVHLESTLENKDKEIDELEHDWREISYKLHEEVLRFRNVQKERMDLHDEKMKLITENELLINRLNKQNE